ncbi:MAG: response regulator transcription factor [bacterium]|nr:response regulator transcription factor [bacterium]
MERPPVGEHPYRLLIVEDDNDLGHILAAYLRSRGFEPTHRADSTSVVDLLRVQQFDLCVLDVVMPELDGFELAEQIRTLFPQLPFIFLTARQQRDDRLKGLGLGAIDYICKPFEVEELELRIRNLLERISPRRRSVLDIGRFRLDRERFELAGPHGSRHLTERELDLLSLLAENAGSVVTRTEITKQLWGHSDYFSGRSLDVFVSRLRSYLADDPNIELRSIRGVGLILDARAREEDRPN